MRFILAIVHRIAARVDHPRRDGKFESEAGGGKRNFGHLVGDLNWKAVLYSVWDAHENF